MEFYLYSCESWNSLGEWLWKFLILHNKKSHYLVKLIILHTWFNTIPYMITPYWQLKLSTCTLGIVPSGPWFTCNTIVQQEIETSRTFYNLLGKMAWSRFWHGTKPPICVLTFGDNFSIPSTSESQMTSHNDGEPSHCNTNRRNCG